MIDLINVEESLRNALEIIGWYCKHHDCKTCDLKINSDTCITDKDPDVWWMYLNADRKTENSSEKPNNSTISKMEQVEDEPRTPYDNCQSCLHWVYDGYWYCECNECHYEPKDEPQTCEECEHWSDIEDGCADRHGCKTEPTISKMEQVDKDINVRSKGEPQTEDGIMPEVKAGVRFDENNKTLWIKTDTVENYDRVIIEDGSNWCRIFYEECGECAHNKPRSNDEPQTDCAWK